MEGLVDQVNITHLHGSALKQQGQQNITGKYSFQEDVQFAESIGIGSTLNEHPFDDIMTTSTDQNVVASHTFTADVTTIASQNLELNLFTINNITLDNIMTINGNQTITGNKIYSTVNFNNMHFMNALQGISSVNEFIANKVSKRGNDVIAGHITFDKGFDVDSDVEVDGLVDGVDIKALLESTQKKDNNSLVIGKNFTSIMKKSTYKNNGLIPCHEIICLLFLLLFEKNSSF